MVDLVIGLIFFWFFFLLMFFICFIGGVIFVYIGDCIGCKKMLVLILLLMGSVMVVIGLLFIYEMVGFWVLVLLIILCIIQGMGIGGEWGGVLLVYEYVLEKWKGFFGSIFQVGVIIGMLMVIFIVLLMMLFDEVQFFVWGWCILFLFSFVFVFFGLWICKDIDEMFVFKQVKKFGQVVKVLLCDMFKYYWWEVLIVVGLKVVEIVFFYIFFIFVVSYVIIILSYQKLQVLEFVILGVLVVIVMILLMGLLLDKVGW